MTILGVAVSLRAVVPGAVAADPAAGRDGVQPERLHLVPGRRVQRHVGFMVDKLTAMMMVVVSFVSLLVHVYTIGYMRDDPGYQRFFSYISLFTFSMLMLVMATTSCSCSSAGKRWAWCRTC